MAPIPARATVSAVAGCVSCGAFGLLGSSFMPLPLSENVSDYRYLNDNAPAANAYWNRRLRKIYATHKCARSAQRDKQDDDFAHLLDCAEDIAGLAVDLREAQPRHQGGRDKQQNQRRNAGPNAETEHKDQNA